MVFFGGLLGGPLGEVLGADLGEPVGDYLREALAVAFGGVLVAVVCLGGPSGEVFFVVVFLVGVRGTPLCGVLGVGRGAVVLVPEVVGRLPGEVPFWDVAPSLEGPKKSW